MAADAAKKSRWGVLSCRTHGEMDRKDRLSRGGSAGKGARWLVYSVPPRTARDKPQILGADELNFQTPPTLHHHRDNHDNLAAASTGKPLSSDKMAIKRKKEDKMTTTKTSKTSEGSGSSKRRRISSDNADDSDDEGDMVSLTPPPIAPSAATQKDKKKTKKPKAEATAPEPAPAPAPADRPPSSEPESATVDHEPPTADQNVTAPAKTFKELVCPDPPSPCCSQLTRAGSRRRPLRNLRTPRLHKSYPHPGGVDPGRPDRSGHYWYRRDGLRKDSRLRPPHPPVAAGEQRAPVCAGAGADSRTRCANPEPV